PDSVSSGNSTRSAPSSACACRAVVTTRSAFPCTSPTSRSSCASAIRSDCFISCANGGRALILPWAQRRRLPAAARLPTTGRPARGLAALLRRGAPLPRVAAPPRTEAPWRGAPARPLLPPPRAAPPFGARRLVPAAAALDVLAATCTLGGL